MTEDQKEDLDTTLRKNFRGVVDEFDLVKDRLSFLETSYLSLKDKIELIEHWIKNNDPSNQNIS